MSSVSFKQYEPGVSVYAPRIADAEWDQHYDLVVSLYNRRVPRWKILEVLAAHNFHPSERQLRSKMKEWALTIPAKRTAGFLNVGLIKPVASASKTQHSVPVALFEGQVGSHSSRKQELYNASAVPDEKHTALEDPVEPIAQTIGPAGNVSQEEPDVRLGGRIILDTHQTPSPQEKFEQQCELPHSSVRTMTTVHTISEGETQIGQLASSEHEFHPGDMEIIVHDEPYVSHPSNSNAPPSSLGANVRPSLSSTASMIALSSELDDSILRLKLMENLNQPQPSTWTAIRDHGTCRCKRYLTSSVPCESSSAFYWNFLHECPSHQVLGHAISLVYIWRTTVAFLPEQDAKYRALIRSTIKLYRQLANRQDIRNQCIENILQELDAIDAALFEDQHELSNLWPRTYNYGDERTVPCFNRVEALHRMLKVHNPMISNRNRYLTTTDKGRDSRILKFAAACRDVLQANLQPIESYLWSISGHDADSDVSLCDLIQNLDRFNVLDVASRIATCLLTQWQKSRHNTDQDQHDHLPTLDTLTMLDAIGLVVARKLEHVLRNVHDYRDLDLHKANIGQLAAIAVMALPGAFTAAQNSPIPSSLSESLKQLIEAYNIFNQLPLASNPKPGYHNLHRGYCDYGPFWKFLDSDVTSFDKVPWMKKPLGRKQRAQEKDRNTSGEVSMRTSSSGTSFHTSETKALPLHAPRSSSPVGSVNSKWSGHVSRESWKFKDMKDMMDIHESSIGPTSAGEELEEIEEGQFDKMQGIEATSA